MLFLGGAPQKFPKYLGGGLGGHIFFKGGIFVGRFVKKNKKFEKFPFTQRVSQAQIKPLKNSMGFFFFRLGKNRPIKGTGPVIFFFLFWAIKKPRPQRGGNFKKNKILRF